MTFKSGILICAFLCTLAICQLNQVDSLPVEDLIQSLPGQPNANFQQYAGYVPVDAGKQRFLFYYFVQAEADSASKPLVLWLNGGPGCSSLGAGAFSEHGPFHASGGGGLVSNEYSWNKEANVLYLESPAGVGFSYSIDKSFYQLVNDTITAQDSLMFLQSWFLKFPEYKDRDFYITGESYAGHYVPQLASLIVESGAKFNLKGIAIGNPLVDFASDINAQGDFYWSHGLVSDSTYKLLLNKCNMSEIWRQSDTGNWTEACTSVNNVLNSEIPGILDGYDVTADTCLSSSSGLLSSQQLGRRNLPLMPNRRFLSSVNFAPGRALGQVEASENPDICVQEKAFDYLNRKDVQGAIHAKLVGVSRWTFCSGVMHYDRSNLVNPTIGVVGSLVRSGIRALVFSGDQDSVIPFMSSRALVNGLATELGLNTTTPYQGWFDTDKQVGGWTQVYGNNMLSYATIRGASHLAPWSSPKRALQLFSAFLAGKTLA